MKNPRRLDKFSCQRRDERNSFTQPNPFVFFIKDFFARALSLFSLHYNTLVFCLPYSYFIIHFCMPIPLQPYPSFTLAMSSAPFTASDNMRLPAYRASHLVRFHPYSRALPAHPSLHEERFMVRCVTSSRSSSILTTPIRPQWTIALQSLLRTLFEVWLQAR